MKNIYRTACWIACLLCCVHTLCGKNVEGDVNYVLIINTYTESTPWSNSMIYPIVSMAFLYLFSCLLVTNQRNIITRFINENDNFIIVDEYVDDGW